MTNNIRSKSKKALVITSINEELYPLFPKITNRKDEEILIYNDLESVVLDKNVNDHLLRNIILAVYDQDVEDIYFIAEETIDPKLNSEVMEKLISKSIDSEQFTWLVEPANVEKAIRQNVDFMQNHPLIPDSVSVHGYVANIEEEEFAAVI